MSVRFRIRTSAGQELSFATHEMFEDFVRSGGLSPDDLVYDAEDGSWAPSRTHPIVLEIEYEKEDAAEAAAAEKESSADNAFGLDLADAPDPVEDEEDADPDAAGAAGDHGDAVEDEVAEADDSTEASFGLALARAEDLLSPEEAAQAFVEKMEAERSNVFEVGGSNQGSIQGFTMEDTSQLAEMSAKTPAPPPPTRPAPKRERTKRKSKPKSKPKRSSEASAPPRRPTESSGKGRKIVLAVLGIGVLGAGGYFGLQFSRTEPVETPPDTVETVTPIPVETPPDPPPPDPVIASTEAAVRERALERFLTATQNELRDLVPVPEIWPTGEYLSFPSDHQAVLDVWQDYLVTIRRVRAADEDRYTFAYEVALDDAAVTGDNRQPRLNTAIADFDASLVLRDAHYDRVEALASAAIQSHNALVEAEGLILFDATGATGATGPIGRGTFGRDADAQSLLDQVLDLISATLDADGAGPRDGANVRAWVWDGLLDAVAN
jgi:hypothetical protein